MCVCVCVCVCVLATVLLQISNALTLPGPEPPQGFHTATCQGHMPVQTITHIKKTAAAVLLSFSIFLKLVHVQVELLSGMGLGFQDTNGSAGSGTLTSSGTYLTTANFTGNGSFEAVVLPSLTNTTGCGSYSNPLIELAVLVTSLDATVRCCSCCACLCHACTFKAFVSFVGTGEVFRDAWTVCCSGLSALCCQVLACHWEVQWKVFYMCSQLF